ncbi:hypothetical protein C9374_011770 [Naegleria lovaniensis]|uniref:ZZ-type domain-containing protein n=1 Tax=Naegleria lovaniensis TaxID=51637 RepID=A0AA88GEB0_NAELO|nr:uncharacterized protein C9374_011770 [Naegleria lovaniensis]KAG2373885.1 hypothetical protein C9374_011770 [Naegleria lovaniensis]
MFRPSQFPASTNTIYQTIQPTANNMNNNNAMVITHPFQPSTIDVQQHIKVYIFEKKKEEITSCLEEKDAQSIRRNIVSLAKFGYTELIQYITEKCGVNAEKAIIRYLDDENQWVDVSSEEEWKFAVQTFQSARKISHNRPVLKLAIVQIKSEEPKSQEQECPFVRCHRRRRAGVCPFKQQQHRRCPYLFRKDENTGDAVLELDVDVNDLKSGNILKNLDKVQMPHYGVTCDGCGEYAFVGRRFKCDQCPDFDFCEKCYETETSNHYGGNHSFTERIAPGRSYLNRLFEGQQQPESSNTTPEEETVVDNQLYEKTVEVEPEVVAEEQPVSVEPVAVEQPQVVEEPEVVEPPVVVEQQVPVSRMPHPLNPVFIQSPTVPVQQPIIVPYSTELNLLKEMGFFDERRCLELLKKYNGDIQRVIVDLLH